MDLLPYVRMEMVYKLRFYAVLFYHLNSKCMNGNGLNDWENGWSITWNILFIDSICMCKLLHSVRKLTVTMGYTKMCTSYSRFMLKLWLASPDLAVIWQVKWQPIRNVSSMKNRVKINYTWKLNINILFAMHHIFNV